jgi:glycerol uptake facilitator-like aquaporin
MATVGLLAVIWGCRAHRELVTAFAVGAYITDAYWFTASTSFANPAVTIARSLTDKFAGIRPSDAPGFILAQVAGLLLALPLLHGRQAALIPTPYLLKPDATLLWRRGRIYRYNRDVR